MLSLWECLQVMNFTSGMIVSVFAFLFQLPSLLASYQVFSHHNLSYIVSNVLHKDCSGICTSGYLVQ